MVKEMPDYQVNVYIDNGIFCTDVKKKCYVCRKKDITILKKEYNELKNEINGKSTTWYLGKDMMVGWENWIKEKNVW